ncbi:MAG: hypothetical protein ACOX50_01165 [Patescibacteria group bacterium]|jgi:hypothetical protein
MKKSLFKIILLCSVVFFVFLMVCFSFPDLFALFYVPNWLTEGNVYSLVRVHKPDCLWLDATYPPLYYLTTGMYLKIIQFLGMLSSGIFSHNICPVMEILTNKQFLFWAKLPYLLFHFASAFVFSRFFGVKRKYWFLLWLLNPIVIFVSFIQGQFEIIPSFFLLLSLYFAKKENIYLSALFLGVGGAYKNFPFLLLIPFLIILCRRTYQKLLFIIISMLPYLLSIQLFLNKDFLSALTFSENLKMLDLGIWIGSEKISIYIILYLVLIVFLIKEKKYNFEILIKYGFLFYLIYFLTTFWFPQRLLFLIPFLLLVIARKGNISRFLPLLYNLFFAYTLFLFPGLFDHSLLRPIFPEIVEVDYSFLQLSIIKKIIFSAITGLLILFGYFMLRKDEDRVDITKRNIVSGLAGLANYLLIVVLLALFSHTF